MCLFKHPKLAIQRLANLCGYRIEKIANAIPASIDVLDLVLSRLAAQSAPVFFVQVGANDGATSDPIRKYIERYHWTGILIEPQLDAFQKLISSYSSHPQLLFENAAIVARDGPVPMYSVDSSSDHYSLFATLHRGNLKKQLGSGVSIRESAVPGLSVATLKKKYSLNRLDFLQIDTEGHDYEIIKLFIGESLRPTVINFEHVHLSASERWNCYRFLAELGYRLSAGDMDTVALLAE